MNRLSSNAPWGSNAHKYKSLSDLNYEKENVTWYWRVIGQIASWMVLGGYLMLPGTFDDNAEMRFSKGVLSIIIVALLTGGYSLTALLWFACPSILFRVDSIFLPIFSVSLFGFLATIYAFASSSRYSFSSTSAPVTLALTVFSAILYGSFALLARRKISKMTHRAPDRSSYNCSPNRNSYNTTPTAVPWQEPAFYQNFIQNMHPTARSHNSFDGASSINVPLPTEDELVNRQMEALLHKQDAGPNQTASRETFTIQWPHGEEEETDRLGNRRMRTLSAGTNAGLLSPGHTRNSRSHSESSRSATWTQIARVMGSERGRNGRPGGSGSGPGHQRTKSREERRREIELNTFS
ncbi:hypothetical protein E2P81_ATG10849 [Venturia nashicola]|uniref:Uncharacterized protein n=1 Tax=Venturia nashicola TaxID=86259 RepID=A0A4Z1PAF0_9PEZI|nr:hypothetical protein E6O75_ATG10522 [Venturia nashicola]TLD27561.1 hypothetical protein E2P81_ATG10849 [Venturia nashicola]